MSTTQKIVSAIAIVVIVLAGLKMLRNKSITTITTVSAGSGPTVSAPVSVATQQPAQVIDPWLAYTQTAVPEGGPMTGEQCAAAGAAAGWSATWGPASDGCWIISPDGQQTRHLGTWAGE